MSARPFSWAEAERRLGPDAMAAMEREVEKAPPLSPAQMAALRALFAPAVSRPAGRPVEADTADAA